jgi:hypothetical protein
MDIAELLRHSAHLSQVWEYYINKESMPPNRQWGRWLDWNPPERIEEAIKALGRRLQKPQPMTGGNEGMHAYVTSTLIAMRKKAGEVPRAWEPTFEVSPSFPDRSPQPAAEPVVIMGANTSLAVR